MPGKKSGLSLADLLLSKGFYILVPLSLIIVVVMGFMGVGMRNTGDEYTSDGRLVITYWEKWTGFEADAMQKVVDAFNASHFTNSKGEIIYVKRESFSGLDRKFLVSISGNSPPDLCGGWNWMIPTYADKGALYQYDDWAEENGLNREYFLTNIWNIISYKGHVYGMPTTPGSIALHYNKRLFIEAGLDPARPPRTIDELDLYSKKMTIISGAFRDRNRDGKTNVNDVEEMTYYQLEQMTGVKDISLTNFDFINISQVGFHPSEPGWWPYIWVDYFGGGWWDGSNVTIINDGNRATYEWVQKYTERFGYNNLDKFLSSRGDFGSPQNPFIAGQAAMVIQGVWMYNFIEKYAGPGWAWGAAPFPNVREDMAPYSLLECDVLLIPYNCKHLEEALMFAKFLERQDQMETLCLGQRKFSPLTKVSPEFYAQHPNPYIRMFRELAESPASHQAPYIEVWNEVNRHIIQLQSKLIDGTLTSEEFLEELDGPVQKAFERSKRREHMIEERKHDNE